MNVEGTLQFAPTYVLAAGYSASCMWVRYAAVLPEPILLVAESAEFRERAEHLVEYTHSKSTIEQLMQQTRLTLPLTIAAPRLSWAITSRLPAPAVSSGYSAWA